MESSQISKDFDNTSLTNDVSPEWRQRTWIVIAAFNEAATISDVIEQLIKQWPNIVVIDDGSLDNTAQTAAQAGAKVACHVINRGQGAALQTGLEFALRQGAEIIVTMDGDGQHNMADIPNLIQPILKGQADVVLGSRFLGSATNLKWSRKVLLKAGVIFTRAVSGAVVSDAHNGMRALSRSAAEQIDLRMDRMAHASEIIDQIVALKLRYVEAPVTVRYTDYSLQKGQSSFRVVPILFNYMLGKLMGDK